jgi:RNA polymerase sigma-70 factor (sigma-E family)
MVEAHARALLRTAYLLTGDAHLAEDLLQTALAKTWFRWRTLRDPGAAPAYVRAVMATTSTAWWRRKWNREVATEHLPERAGLDDYDAVDTRDLVARALRTLTARQRAVLVLRYFDDMPEAAVAEALGCSLGTVKSTSSRALAVLRAAMWADAETADRPA